MRKPAIFMTCLFAAAAFASCKRDVEYVDLSSGETVALEKDSTGAWVNAETKAPVVLYVNKHTHDTIYGPTGEVVNNKVVHRDGGYYYGVAEVDSYTGHRSGSQDESGEYKMKVDKDGSYKIKRGDDYKKEVEADGDVTIKNGNTKVKIDGETGERKVKRDD